MKAVSEASNTGAVACDEPPIARAWTQAAALTFTHQLRAELHCVGVFRGDTVGYWRRGIGVTALTLCAWAGLFVVDGVVLRLAAALLAGYIGVQASAIAHEAGHGAVTRNSAWRWRMGRFFMTFGMGASYSAWVKRHGGHHQNPNSRDDPDLRPGFFRFNPVDAIAARGLAGWCTRHQHLLLLPASSLMGFSLKIAGWMHVLKKPSVEWRDLFVLFAHLAVWIALPTLWVGLSQALLSYLFLTWIQGIYLAFVFLPNHLGSTTAEEASSWPPALRQIITTRNLPDSVILTHLCMGLNTHIEHHLFGNLPATRLAEAREITRRHCQRHGVPYAELSVRKAFGELQRYNRRIAYIARQAHQLRQQSSCGFRV
jgi:fatty acid desaturase